MHFMQKRKCLFWSIFAKACDCNLSALHQSCMPPALTLTSSIFCAQRPPPAHTNIHPSVQHRRAKKERQGKLWHTAVKFPSLCASAFHQMCAFDERWINNIKKKIIGKVFIFHLVNFSEDAWVALLSLLVVLLILSGISVWSLSLKRILSQNKGTGDTEILLKPMNIDALPGTDSTDFNKKKVEILLLKLILN